MKVNRVDSPIIRIAVLEEDPLRLAGFRAILNAVPDFRLTAMSVSEIAMTPGIHVVLLSNYSDVKFVDTMADLRAFCPHLRALVIGSGMDEQLILKALTCGAKGYVDETAAVSSLVQAIYGVFGGSVWAPRYILSALIERSSELLSRNYQAKPAKLTCREQEVLTMLVEGRSNKEIGNPLRIRERTVKAHISKLMRKMGARNRIALCVAAISQLPAPALAH
jgi:DNA-binding NarL/FixJ family response regulator